MREPVETFTAVLPSAGYNYNKWTTHTYSHSELVTLKSGGVQITGLARMYRCAETGEPRRWGFDRTCTKDNGGN